jgi:hypothetical protein
MLALAFKTTLLKNLKCPRKKFGFCKQQNVFWGGNKVQHSTMLLQHQNPYS